MAERTKYVVQRRHAEGTADPRTNLWEDVGTFDARSTVEAVELAAGSGRDARAGVYRTLAARYLSEPVPVEVTTEVVVNVGGRTRSEQVEAEAEPESEAEPEVTPSAA